MKQYLSKIQALANELLDIIYDGEFKLAQFNVTTDTFEVPYVKNGKKIPDIKYASQSELALGTMALSFALSNQSTGIYNIILVDELDAGLDSENRALFLRMLYKQMEILHAEQIFIISHNLAQMTNVPMDCIMLGEVSSNSSKLQHIIYKKE
jgi:chromosome segregation ATPase